IMTQSLLPHPSLRSLVGACGVLGESASDGTQKGRSVGPCRPTGSGTGVLKAVPVRVALAAGWPDPRARDPGGMPSRSRSCHVSGSVGKVVVPTKLHRC